MLKLQDHRYLPDKKRFYLEPGRVEQLTAIAAGKLLPGSLVVHRRGRAWTSYDEVRLGLVLSVRYDGEFYSDPVDVTVAWEPDWHQEEDVFR